ncbi:hypothetical protein KR222_007740 [Zaprionus bogoriensis]|nr:hypothetical protein KR222_007740 [Zaprionus bogoriensis]
MLRFGLAILSVGLALSVVLGQIDYCDKSLCSTNVTHIACNTTGARASTCPTDPEPVLVELTIPLKRRIVAAHNVRRNRLALGGLPKFATARRMATMRWSPQLASLAELNVLQCTMKHDACHNTLKFKQSGQNLALISYTGDNDRYTNLELIVDAISGWWSEKQYANMAVINSYPSSWTGPEIGHFTEMAQQANYAVGCGVAKYVVNSTNNFLLACNYATTNIVGKPVYVRGSTAAGCTTGTNVNYDGLCKVAEVYNL